MSEVLIVFLSAFHNVLDHRAAIAPATTNQVALAKGFEQGLRLVEPGCVRGRE